MNNKTELRAAAARLLYNNNRDTSDYNMLIDFIDNYFDSQQPQTGWIPVSERLPEENDEILVTTNWGQVLIAEFCEFGWRTEIEDFDNNEIIAWQPIPQPYKESE